MTIRASPTLTLEYGAGMTIRVSDVDRQIPAFTGMTGGEGRNDDPGVAYIDIGM